MRQIVLKQNKNLKYLPLAFNNNIKAVKEELEAGHPKLNVFQVQDVNGILFSVNREINQESIYELFGAQIEMLLDILKYLNENIEVYERYELLKGFIAEYELIKQLVTKPIFDILNHHIDFMGNELVLLVNNHIERIDEELKIKNHKSFVRINLIDKGVVAFTTGVNDVEIKGILAFLKLKCAKEADFLALENELSNNTESHQEFYNLKNVTPDDMILFFKIMQDRQILSKITNKDLSKWLHRKFRYFKNGDYLIGQSQRTTLDKLNVKLTAKEKIKELNIHFKK
ncbi:hypothetical protein [Pedobacter insulae]|uniref:Uncharacterized protein n=1 Tax=Pedobacter insulae TaxID=414048 RepID=A0A1I3AHF8_9SPHI|nr:hypothetical protein [Pedobacter insulae]SFH48781.1 hypothetical protein SAMN04489864_11470 [Pedobacter insulae]